MKKLMTSTFLAVAAVPFLMAAPKAQAPATSTPTTTTTAPAKTKAVKKHKKSHKAAPAAQTSTEAPKK